MSRHAPFLIVEPLLHTHRILQSFLSKYAATPLPGRYNMADDNGIYSYKPNGPICIVSALLSGASAVYHLFQMIRTKTRVYTPLVVGSLSKLSLGNPCEERTTPQEKTQN